MRSTSGNLTVTAAQMFIGALATGALLFRATTSQVQHHQETLRQHADYAASTLGAAHARSANTIATNNTIAASIMGPRICVEADNITMDVNADIACPTCPHGGLCHVCREYRSNKPRAVAKLQWARATQDLVWKALNALSGKADRVASLAAQSTVEATLAGDDPGVRVSFEDGSLEATPWGSDNTSAACDLATTDALGSPMVGHAFPTLMTNLTGALPRALVRLLPKALCKATAGVTNAPGKIRLDGVPQVQRAAKLRCSTLREEVREAMAVPAPPELSEGAARWTQCEPARPAGSPSLGLRRGLPSDAVGDSYWACHFDEQACLSDALEAESEAYLGGLGLPSAPSITLAVSSTRAPTSAPWNRSPELRVCATAQKALDGRVTGFADALRELVSFGSRGASRAAREEPYVHACAHWYFPDGSGPFADVATERQPFTAAWKFGLTL